MCLIFFSSSSLAPWRFLRGPTIWMEFFFSCWGGTTTLTLKSSWICRMNAPFCPIIWPWNSWLTSNSSVTGSRSFKSENFEVRTSKKRMLTYKNERCVHLQGMKGWIWWLLWMKSVSCQFNLVSKVTNQILTSIACLAASQFSGFPETTMMSDDDGRGWSNPLPLTTFSEPSALSGSSAGGDEFKMSH